VPNTYEGSIDSNGSITLNIHQVDTGYYNNVRSGIGKLIANHFNNDSNKQEKFLQNKEEIEARINNFRTQLKVKLWPVSDFFLIKSVKNIGVVILFLSYCKTWLLIFLKTQIW